MTGLLLGHSEAMDVMSQQIKPHFQMAVEQRNIWWSWSGLQLHRQTFSAFQGK